MIKTLLEQLHLCTATSSLQMIFSSPPILYNIFFPVMKENKRNFSENNVIEKESSKKMKQGSYIQNLTGQRLMLPKELEKKYCTYYLDSGRSCNYGKNCRFVRVIYPTGFTPNDKVIMDKCIQETDGLSVVKDKKVSQD